MPPSARWARESVHISGSSDRNGVRVDFSFTLAGVVAIDR
jgi:hypothetical protein